MRRLTIPETFVVVPLVLGCAPDARVDAGTDAVEDAPRDVTDVAAVTDVADAMGIPDAMDAMDASFDAYPEVDIIFSERREIDPPDGAVCMAQRIDGGIRCHEENVQGSGLFCIRYLCEADDGGASLADCCRLVG